MNYQRKQSIPGRKGRPLELGNQVAYQCGMRVALPSIAPNPVSAPSGNAASAMPAQGETFSERLHVSVQAVSPRASVLRKPKVEPEDKAQSTPSPSSPTANTLVEMPVPQPTLSSAIGFCMPNGGEDNPSCIVAAPVLSPVQVPPATPQDEGIDHAAPSKPGSVFKLQDNSTAASDPETPQDGTAPSPIAADASGQTAGTLLPDRGHPARTEVAGLALPIEPKTPIASGPHSTVFPKTPHTANHGTGVMSGPAQNGKPLPHSGVDARLFTAPSEVPGTNPVMRNDQTKIGDQAPTLANTERDAPIKSTQRGGNFQERGPLQVISPAQELPVSVAPVEPGTATDRGDAVPPPAAASNVSGNKGSKSNATGTASATAGSSSLASVQLHALNLWLGGTADPNPLPRVGPKPPAPAAEVPGPEQPGTSAMPGGPAMHLVQSMSRSEMQVHVNAQEFGRISIHTAYGRDAISAQITLQNAQLGSALAVHLPSIEQKLAQDHGVRASVTVDARSTGSNNQSAGSDPEQSRKPRQYGYSLPSGGGSIGSSQSAAGPIPTGIVPGKRLDIHI